MPKLLINAFKLLATIILFDLKSDSQTSGEYYFVA